MGVAAGAWNLMPDTLADPRPVGDRAKPPIWLRRNTEARRTTAHAGARSFSAGRVAIRHAAGRPSALWGG
ncbi:MAG: hypothetical protein QOC64_2771 [Solirubrobacteraceae bacterium]|jgi:hypothetical protein|nr:hypothetical protein [Solirubrobacteraceae bacterium]